MNAHEDTVIALLDDAPSALRRYRKARVAALYHAAFGFRPFSELGPSEQRQMRETAGAIGVAYRAGLE